MKRLVICSGLLLITLVNPVFSVGEAGAIFLLIAPGARAGGLGEAQVAVTDDAYASYWNPAGLGFLKGQELSLMYVPEWLPGFNLDDMYYSFAAYRKSYPYLGTIGGHIIFLSLGEQTRTDEQANYLGKFTSYMAALTISYSALLSDNRSFGLNAKIFHQHLTDLATASEKGKGYSTDFGFDIGYMHKEFLSPRLDLGLTITNIGPKVSFIDVNQGDPQPTNFTLGLNYRLIDEQFNKLNLIYDVDKLLVGAYAAMDWDGDGYIGRYDENGSYNGSGGYNSDGQQETAYSDPIYLGIFTSWVDDWLLGGDRDLAISSSYTPDGFIGGYNWIDSDENGVMDVNQWDDKNENGDMDIGEGEIIESGINQDDIDFGDPNWGIYNKWGQKEVGNSDDRSIKDELKKLIHHFGLEYWYSKYFALRAGYYYDQEGKINNPTFGVGLRFAGYGFDFGFTSGEPGHPLTNTMRFSLNMAINSPKQVIQP